MCGAIAVVVALLLAAGPVAAQVAPEPKDRARAVAKACRGDARQFCQGTRPGAGRLLACLKGHDAELSAACRDMIEGENR